MFFLVFAFFTVNILMWGSELKNIIPWGNFKLSPKVTKHCVSQYMAMIGYHHSRMINEYNIKFLPESEEKKKLIQYQDFLKKIRERRVQPSDFVDIQDEVYTCGIAKTVKYRNQQTGPIE
jgi:hypothetical protein